MPEMELTTPAFDDGEPIPERHSCDGDDVSPRLEWSFLPAQAGSLALVVHDPDAPSGDFLHWLGWNLDPDQGALDEGARVPVEGTNGAGRIGYMGPCPPPGHGAHRYIFRLYALASPLDLEPGAARVQLKGAMDGRVVGKARLTGIYERLPGRCS
jgi:Raf kinase inhibitor-like YbhB/YbcL family protein